jgi:hypothetical protein
MPSSYPETADRLLTAEWRDRITDIVPRYRSTIYLAAQVAQAVTAAARAGESC